MAGELAGISREGYSIDVIERSQRVSVVLNGTFDMAASEDVQHFLEDLQSEVMATNPGEVEIDVSAVYYLGSSCMKAFVSLTAALKAAVKQPTLRILTSSRLDWQGRTFAVLARLAPKLVS